MFFTIKVTTYLNISDKSIDAYKECFRKMSITKFYKLIQLYKAIDISDFLNNFSK